MLICGLLRIYYFFQFAKLATSIVIHFNIKIQLVEIIKELNLNHYKLARLKQVLRI